MTLYDLRSEIAREHGWHEDDDGDRIDEVLNERFAPHALEMYAALENMVGARALSEVRSLVAGWNGEDRQDGPYKERHPSKLGATLPKTNCGAIYELDDAITNARRILNAARGES